jgi:hypothetical protein
MCCRESPAASSDSVAVALVDRDVLIGASPFFNEV